MTFGGEARAGNAIFCCPLLPGRWSQPAAAHPTPRLINGTLAPSVRGMARSDLHHGAGRSDLERFRNGVESRVLSRPTHAARCGFRQRGPRRGLEGESIACACGRPICPGCGGATLLRDVGCRLAERASSGSDCPALNRGRLPAVHSVAPCDRARQQRRLLCGPDPGHGGSAWRNS